MGGHGHLTITGGQPPQSRTGHRPGIRLPPLLRRPRLSIGERAALGLWAAAHLALLALAWAAAWVYRGQLSHAPLAGVFGQWDAVWLRSIAAHGYFSGQSKPHAAAFFPGYPLVLAAAHLALRNWTVSELAVSAVAGCFAVVSLTRLAGSRRAVLYLLTMPAAVFLTVGYAECLYLAFAIPAWRAGTRGRWGTAALLAALAGLVRPTGLFLIPALAVMALAGPPGRRLRSAAIACAGFTGPAAYELYLRACTGSWNAWREANQAGWGLHFTSPWSAWKTTWAFAFGHVFAAGSAFEYQMEIAAIIVMAAVTIAFLACRRWPEAVYCGLAVVALGTQAYYQTGTRTLLVLFPVYVALAALEVRRPQLRVAYFSVCAPLAAVVGLLFLSGQWAG